MSKFEEANENVMEILRRVIRDHFPELGQSNIKVIINTKKRMSGGKIVLGRMEKANDLIKFFTTDDTTNEEGYDYIMSLDGCAVDLATPEDLERLIRHECRHTLVDTDSRKPYKLRGHSIEDFHSEIRLNEDHPRWGEELAGRVLEQYETEDEAE